MLLLQCHYVVTEWVEEGVATLKDNVYVGSVGHFSWHNLDVPEERVTLKGRVTDCKGRPVSRVLVTVDQTSDLTTSDGSYQVYVPFDPTTYVCKASDKGGYEVSITGTGEAIDVATYESRTATITGKVYIPIFIETSQAQNVSKWSDVGTGASIPEMPLPIDHLVKMKFGSLDATIAGLAYKNKTESDYNSIKSTVEKAGYTIVETEVSDEEGNKIVSYKKDDNFLVIAYSPTGGANIVGDDSDYKLTILICEGYSKIQQFGNLFNPGATTRSATILQTERMLKRLRR